MVSPNAGPMSLVNYAHNPPEEQIVPCLAHPQVSRASFLTAQHRRESSPSARVRSCRGVVRYSQGRRRAERASQCRQERQRRCRC